MGGRVGVLLFLAVEDSYGGASERPRVPNTRSRNSASSLLNWGTSFSASTMTWLSCCTLRTRMCTAVRSWTLADVSLRISYTKHQPYQDTREACIPSCDCFWLTVFCHLESHKRILSLSWCNHCKAVDYHTTSRQSHIQNRTVVNT